MHLRGKIIEGERVLEAQKVDSEADKKFRKAVADADPKDSKNKRGEDDNTAASGEG